MKTLIMKNERKNFEYNFYEIDISNSMKEQSLNFAKQIILSDNQFLRLTPANILASNDIELIKKMEIQRTYVGKLAELAFLELLRNKGKNVNTDGMFEIFEGQNRVDPYDFIAKNKKTVDIKAGFRACHTRLVVNEEQLRNVPKDYYVGVKLNGRDVDNQDNKFIDLDTIDKAIVYGYAECSYLKTRAKSGNLGEGPCKWIPYNGLMGIDRLLNIF